MAGEVRQSGAGWASVFAVVGGIMVPTALGVLVWALLSKPISYQFLALAVVLGVVGAALIAVASGIDQEAQAQDHDQ